MQFTPEQTAALLAALGLPNDTADPQLVVDTAADLAAQAAGINTEKPSTIAAAAKKAGLEVVDTDTLTALKADAAEGRRVAAAARRADIEGKVAAAVNRGALTPSRSKHWVALIEADPAMADVLAAVPDEAVIPMSELGHSSGTGTADDADTGKWLY